MKIDIAKEPDKEIRNEIREIQNKIFTAAGGKADINSVMLYSPVIQMLSNELTGRFIKRTTRLALGVAFLSLAVSAAALYVSYTSTRVGPVSETPIVSSPASEK